MDNEDYNTNNIDFNPDNYDLPTVDYDDQENEIYADKKDEEVITNDEVV